ncbi:uncharacterized protein LOC129725816 [Wyeomyia smithii]|uniref:uncharacterized protein LOC129725816 n=1 Tax=Wyeomyia smithii TaxID=174621 RepID=UPI002467C37C|nr:uncharacterized protein LOC129725816 [Wyeomyia smithii]
MKSVHLSQQEYVYLLNIDFYALHGHKRIELATTVSSVNRARKSIIIYAQENYVYAAAACYSGIDLIMLCTEKSQRSPHINIPLAQPIGSVICLSDVSSILLLGRTVLLVSNSVIVVREEREKMVIPVPEGEKSLGCQKGKNLPAPISSEVNSNGNILGRAWQALRASFESYKSFTSTVWPYQRQQQQQR